MAKSPKPQLLSREQYIRLYATIHPIYFPGCRVELVSSGTAVKGIVLAYIASRLELPPAPFNIFDNPEIIRVGFFIHWDFQGTARYSGRTYQEDEIQFSHEQLSLEQRLTHSEPLVQDHARLTLYNFTNTRN